MLVTVLVSASVSFIVAKIVAVYQFEVIDSHVKAMVELVKTYMRQTGEALDKLK